MKKLIITAAVAALALAGGLVGVAATPNKSPDTCVLAFMKAEYMIENPSTIRAQAVVYENLRNKCMAGK